MKIEKTEEADSGTVIKMFFLIGGIILFAISINFLLKVDIPALLRGDIISFALGIINLIIDLGTIIFALILIMCAFQRRN